MEEIQIIGAPFDVIHHHSSNSNLYPQTFRWTLAETPTKVFCDNAIMLPLVHDIPKEEGTMRVGWICESNSVVPDLVRRFQESYQVILDHCEYDVIFTCDKSLCELDNRIQFSLAGSNLPWTPKEEQKIYDKTKLCSMIASPKGEGPNASPGHAFRVSWAEKLRNSLDLYGGAFGTKRIGFSSDLNKVWHNKAEALYDYMFSVVIENGSYDDYHTEKITDAFATGTVPIYHGSPSVIERFNPDGIILLNDDFRMEDLTEDLYQSKLDAIRDNFDRVQNLQGSDDLLYENIINAGVLS